MTRVGAFRPTFVEEVPEELEDGRLYIAIALRTMVHRCACGCGREVATPISPTGWRLSFDGRSVSLDPSIGNWAFPCRSHYWIEENTVQWAAAWTDAEILAARAADRAGRTRRPLRDRAAPEGPAPSPAPPTLLRRLLERWRARTKRSR